MANNPPQRKIPASPAGTEPIPSLVADYQCHCGEGPLWHPTQKKIYWTDINTGRMFRFDPATRKHEQCYTGRPVGGFTIQADGALLLFMDQGTVAVWRDGKIQRTIVDKIPDEVGTRFNDVIADPQGRVFCGTMAAPAGDGKPRRLGRLYRLDTDGSIRIVLEGIGCSNGMAFTANLKKMYYTDSTLREIYTFDYDRATGAIANRKLLVKLPDTMGFPDGMTLDSKGDLWSATWDSWCLIRYSPRGKEKQRILFPAKKVSSVIFGNEDLGTMYVTTAGGEDKTENGQGAGALFKLQVPGVTGVPEFCSRVGL